MNIQKAKEFVIKATNLKNSEIATTVAALNT